MFAFFLGFFLLAVVLWFLFVGLGTGLAIFALLVVRPLTWMIHRMRSSS
jgi:hypothetical protein